MLTLIDAVEEIVVDTCKTDTAEFCNSESQTDISRGISVEIQTDITMGHLVDYSTEDLKAGAGLRRKMFMKSVLKDDSSCKFYTGKVCYEMTDISEQNYSIFKFFSFFKNSYT